MTLDPRKIQIVVVEDNPADVELLRLALIDAALEHELTVLADGGEALAFFEQRGKYSDATAPDLAILDLNLPKNGGLEVLTAMRRNPAFEKVAVTVLSSSSWPREKSGLAGLRVLNFITKPSDLDQYMRIGHMVKEIITQIS